MILTCSDLMICRGVFVAALILAAAPLPMRGQWNGTNPIWTNSNVGIGTASPSQKLAVTGSDSSAHGVAASIGIVNVASGGRTWYLRAGATGTATPAGGFSVADDAAYRLVIDSNGKVGIGTTNPQYKLAVNGNIGAQDIIVTNTGWSDYVFRPEYRLRPLSEVNRYIQENGHLPGIPTEGEVKERGVSLGDMQAKLLAKIEELTLHMIRQEKETSELRGNLTKENRELRERLARLERSTVTDSTFAVAK